MDESSATVDESQESEQVPEQASDSSTLTKPPQNAGENFARYRWRILRTLLKQAVRRLIECEQKNDITITHGMHHVHQVTHERSITNVMFNSLKQEYLLYDGISIHRLFADDQQSVATSQNCNRLIYVEPMLLFVGWTCGKNELHLMTSQFDLRSTTSAPGPVNAVVYNPNLNEVVAVGNGYCGSWMFRYGGRVLQPHRLICGNLTSSDQFTLVVLEETTSRHQRAFAVNGRAVAVFNLTEGTIVSYKSNLHSRRITAILFYNYLKCLITAAKDGTIKVWDDDWHLQLVFIGHIGMVTCLAIHPYGTNIVSAGADHTLRVWSLETCDQLEKIEMKGEIKQLCTTPNLDDVIAVCDEHIDVWRISHIYSLHTRVGSNVESMTCTSHPNLPTRAVLRCRDASVRIISPHSGDVLTTFLAPSDHCILSVAYAVAEDTMFTVFEDGTITKIDTCINPCRVMAEWHCPEPSAAAECLLVYNYIISQKDGGGAARRAMVTKGLPGGSAGRYKDLSRASRTLLLGGRKDGYLCVYNWDNGRADYVIQGHDDKGILNMTIYDKEDRLITAGRDMLIKIWRVYAFALETLSLLASIYCMQTPLHTIVSNNKLVVAFQDHSTATYSIVMYHLQTKDRRDHPSVNDHRASVTGLTSCGRMKLVASCSTDGTVRIWNYENKLIRLIQLNAVPSSMCFCNQHGDLLLGISDHVYRIDHKQFLPRTYLAKIMAVDFVDEVPEKRLPFDDNLVNMLNRDDMKRLKSAHSTFKFTHFVDIQTHNEADELKLQRKNRETELAMLEARDLELKLIRDGQLAATKKPKSSAETRKEAFNKYLKMFCDRPKIELPQLDSNKDEEQINDKLSSKQLEVSVKEGNSEEPFLPEREPLGFFPPPGCKRPVLPSVTSHPRWLPPADGFIPNSVLIRLLFPAKSLEEKEREKASDDYRPPVLTLDQVQFMSDYNKKVPGTTEDQDDDIRQWHSTKAKQKKEEAQHLDRMATLLSKADKSKSTMSQEDVDTTNDQIQQRHFRVVADILELDQPISRPVSRASVTSAPRSSTAVVLSQLQLQPKSSSSSRAASASIRPVEIISDEPEPTFSAPKSSVLDFVSRFNGRSWFDRSLATKVVTNAISIDEFVLHLCQTLRVADFSTKTDIIKSLPDLLPHVSQKTRDSVWTAVSSLLQGTAAGTHPLQYEDDQVQRFLQAALQLLHTSGVADKEFYVELMIGYIEGNKETRAKVLEILMKCGLKDVKHLFIKELNSWDVWCVSEDRTTQLRDRAVEFLEKWLICFQNHIRDVAEKLRNGQSVEGQIMSRSLRGKIKTAKAGVSQSTAVLTVTVTDMSAVNNATFIEAINYYCEMTLNKQLLQSQMDTSQMPSAEGIKNTVVSLPRLKRKHGLVRLGDMHSSKCHEPRPPYAGNDMMNSTITVINLPMKRVLLNPFPSPLDQYDPLYSDHVLMTLQTAQKYFVQARSFVPNY